MQNNLYHYLQYPKWKRSSGVHWRKRGWMNHDIHSLNEIIMPREASQSEHGRSYMIILVWDTQHKSVLLHRHKNQNEGSWGSRGRHRWWGWVQDLLNYLMPLREKHLGSVCFTKIKMRRQQIPKPRPHSHITQSATRPCTDENSHPRGMKHGALGKCYAAETSVVITYVSPGHSQHGA